MKSLTLEQIDMIMDYIIFNDLIRAIGTKAQIAAWRSCSIAGRKEVIAAWVKADRVWNAI